MLAFYAVGVLLLINAQVNSLPAATLNYVDLEEESFNEITELESIESLAEYDYYDYQEIESLITIALLEYQSEQPPISQECYQQGLQELLALKKHKKPKEHNFLKCKRLREGLKKKSQLLSKTFHVAVDLTKQMNSIAQGWAKCVKGNKVQKAICVTKNVISTVNRIKKLVPKLKRNASVIKKLIKELHEIYKHCKH
ncbi:uncharacterized protein [Rhodnius prolixus]|uniref:uncharacterized protein n=1 Tax=Rhodnius prolixus TaxID=13249 RepID=UPI003D18E6A1